MTIIPTVTRDLRSVVNRAELLRELMEEREMMLEALKRCNARMSAHPMWDSEDAGPSQTLQLVRAAIAKAEGRA